MRSDVNFQISRAGLSHPGRVLAKLDGVFHCSYYQPRTQALYVLLIQL